MPLKRAIDGARAAQVTHELIDYANEVVWAAESEVVLSGIKIHFDGIEVAYEALRPKMKKLEAAVKQCEVRGANSKATEECRAMLQRFTAEVSIGSPK